MAKFIPRAVFPPQLNLIRSYFLGHHAAALSKIKALLSSIDLVIECRDYRVPLTSRNPQFEQALSGVARLVIYTKKDLASKNRRSDYMRQEIMKAWHAPQPTFFTSCYSKPDMNALLSYIVDHASRTQSLLGSRVLVVGMPNVGKSALLNALRGAGMNNHTKAARTGAQPGITRKIATSVNIVPKDGRTGFEGVSLVDTPGVFVPFVPDGESMLKMTLVGSVKEKLIAPTLLCDYLLYQINRQPDGPKFYAKYCPPTNDVVEFLESVCGKTGMLGKGGEPDMDRAALWMMYRWRHGHLGAFILDDVVEDGLMNKTNEEIGTSVSQARKLAKEAQRARGKARHAASIAV